MLSPEGGTEGGEFASTTEVAGNGRHQGVLTAARANLWASSVLHRRQDMKYCKDCTLERNGSYWGDMKWSKDCTFETMAAIGVIWNGPKIVHLRQWQLLGWYEMVQRLYIWDNGSYWGDMKCCKDCTFERNGSYWGDMKWCKDCTFERNGSYWGDMKWSKDCTFERNCSYLQRGTKQVERILTDGQGEEGADTADIGVQNGKLRAT